jgi:hypothetical protein
MIHGMANPSKLQRVEHSHIVFPVNDRGQVPLRTAPVYRATNRTDAERKIRDLMLRFPGRQYSIVETVPYHAGKRA